MSAGQIDTLLDLWTATLIKHDDSSPFASHRNLYDTIDSTPLGDIAWESFSMSYNGVKPADNAPPWMNAAYDVWFRDPRLLIHNMLANPDFDGSTEYVPYRDYNDNDQRYFKNFFSGDWAWNQAVCLFFSIGIPLLSYLSLHYHHTGHYRGRSGESWINLCAPHHWE